MSKKKLVIIEDRLDRVAKYADELLKDGAEIEKILIFRGENEFKMLAKDYQHQSFFQKVQRVDSWDFFDALDALYQNPNLLFLFDLCLESEGVEFTQKLTVIYISGKVPKKNMVLISESPEANRFYVYTTQSEQAKEQLARWLPGHVLDTSLTSDILLLYQNNRDFCKSLGMQRG